MAEIIESEWALVNSVSKFFRLVQMKLSVFFLNKIKKLSEDILKGATDKKAGGDIWLPFLQFSTIFNETLSIRPFEPCAQIWPNTTAQCTFYYCTACILHWFSNFKNKKVGKTVQNARCAVQNVHCAHPVSQKIAYKNS